jgi:molybdenum cofactor biosynthesis protein B
MSATRSPISCAPGSPIPEIDVILTTGGTGLTGRDVTVEAHRDVYEKEIEAFATVFTMVSMQKIGTSAVQSRATGGVANGTYLFALPGSSGRARMRGTRS